MLSTLDQIAPLKGTNRLLTLVLSLFPLKKGRWCPKLPALYLNKKTNPSYVPFPP